MSPVLLPFLNVNLVFNNQGTPPWMLFSQLPSESSQQAPNTASRRSGTSRVKPTSKDTLSRARTTGTHTSRDYPDCPHEGVFRTMRQTASHVRRVHLKEKPFECTTWYACPSIIPVDRQSYGALTAESTLRTGQMPIVM
jgi:hypothetical protein